MWYISVGESHPGLINMVGDFFIKPLKKVWAAKRSFFKESKFAPNQRASKHDVCFQTIKLVHRQTGMSTEKGDGDYHGKEYKNRRELF